jgi:EmrB/QacA subfamily drug resistance transporter
MARKGHEARKNQMNQERRDEKTRRSALVVTTLSSFLTPLSLSTVNIALPSIGRTFAVDAITLNWIATAYLLSAAMFLVPIGRLADIYGRKKVFIYGTWVFTISSLCLAASISSGMMIFLRIIQGVGAAMIFGTGVAILSSVYPSTDRGRVLGINIGAVYLGTSFGPFLGGILTQHFGWRSIFFLNVPLGGIIILFGTWRLVGEWADARGERLDVTGSLVYAVAILAIMYGFSLLPGPTGALLVLAGMAGIGVFVWWEMRAERPILDMRLFTTNKVFALSNVAALINYSATFAVGFLLSFYLQYIKGFSPQAAGTIMVSQPIVQAAFSPIAGRVSDRVEPRIVVTAGMALTSLGLFLLVFLQPDTSVPHVVMSLVILGFGFALFSSPNTNAIMGSVENRFYGVASATLATMRLLGQVLSMGIAMLFFTLFMGRVKIVPAHYPFLLKSIKAAFLVFGLLCAFGILASLTRGNVRENEKTTARRRPEDRRNQGATSGGRKKKGGLPSPH